MVVRSVGKPYAILSMNCFHTATEWMRLIEPWLLPDALKRSSTNVTNFAEFSANLSRPPKANAGSMTKAAATLAALSDS